jgi:hypothetical protein
VRLRKRKEKINQNKTHKKKKDKKRERTSSGCRARCSTQKCHHTHRKNCCSEESRGHHCGRSASRLLLIKESLLQQASSATKFSIEHPSLRHTLERNWFQKLQGHTLEEYHVIRSYTILRAYP